MPRRVFIFLKKTGNSVSYLPHRQLRNGYGLMVAASISYLPHRQLRNNAKATVLAFDGYLPHRQLRKLR